MQCDLGQAIQPNRNDAGAGADRRVADHGVILPGTGPEPAGHGSVQRDRNRARQADLTTMRVST